MNLDLSDETLDLMVQNVNIRVLLDKIFNMI